MEHCEGNKKRLKLVMLCSVACVTKACFVVCLEACIVVCMCHGLVSFFYYCVVTRLHQYTCMLVSVVLLCSHEATQVWL